MKNATLAIVALASSFLSLSVPAAAGTDRTFGGYECTDDCSGHKAGYEWAELQGITSPTLCEDMLAKYPSLTSFSEGCLIYVSAPLGTDADVEIESIN